MNVGFTLQVYTHLYNQQRREAVINIGSLNDLPQNDEGEPEER